jgi:hypothetical protein
MMHLQLLVGPTSHQQRERSRRESAHAHQVRAAVAMIYGLADQDLMTLITQYVGSNGSDHGRVCRSGAVPVRRRC